MQRIIRKIEPLALKLPARKRVAAYARVSSGKEAMLHSLSAQVSYYSEFIQKHRGWEYVGVYADEAMTGTKDNRAEFQRLLADCKNGRIDMIITKSISRLARNTVTMLQTVRELKELNVDVFFEKENIHSISGDGELMLTILSSFAQEESLSVSENCKWRIRKQFQDGIPYITDILGYDFIEGKLEVVLKEAEIVRTIFNDFLSGMGRNAIMKKLIASGFETKRGGSWNESTINKILRNEKYVGDMLLQKTFVSNHIEKKQCLNRGELPKYYVKDSHEPIIDREKFERVQNELERRSKKYHPSKQTPITYPFSSKITCQQCGKNYRRKISNSSSNYAKPVWVCSTFNMHGRKVCSSQQIPEDILFSVTAEVLGLAEFDEVVFKQQIKEIRVPGPNILIFVFNNGNTVEKIWQNKSRSDSWSAEAKQQAREKQLKYLERGNSKC